MNRSRWRILRFAVAPVAVAVTSVMAMLGGSLTANATTTTSGAITKASGAITNSALPAAAAGLVRTVVKGASVSFPAGQHMGTPSGFQSPETPPRQGSGGEGFAPISRSARPSATKAFAAAGLQPPVVASSPVGGKAGLTASWQGLDGFEQRYANGGNQFSLEPPDQGLCAGNGYVLEAVNDVLRVFRGSGAPVSGVTDLNTFLGYPAQFDRATGLEGPFVTDPSCVFDHGSGRFYLSVLTIEVDPVTGNFLGPNHLDLAVSRSANPTGGWNIYRLPVQDDGTQGTPLHPDCPCVGDYPHIGSDAHAIFLTTNEYPFGTGPGVFGNNFNGAQIYAFDKQALAGGANSVQLVQFQNTFLPSGGSRVPGFTVWPAQVPDSRYATSHGGTEYLLSSIAGEEAQPAGFTGMASQLGVWAVTNTSSIGSGSPALHLERGLVASEVYGVPPRSTQKPGPVPLRDCLAVNCLDVLGPGAPPDPNEAEGPLDSNDSRMQQVYYSGGTIYGALDTVIRVQGNLQAGIAWFAVHPGASAAASSVTRQGYLGVARNNVNYPALAVLPNGSAAMAFTLVGAGYFPTSAYTLFGSQGPGSVQVAAAGQAPEDGFCEYNVFDCANTPTPLARPRWGDYSAAVTNGSTFFIATEYIGNRCTFATYVKDPTCGGTRAPLINWATRISHVTP
jgi:hypothetical protein